MESAAVFRSFHHCVGTFAPLRSAYGKPGVISTKSTFNSSQNKRSMALVSCVKSSQVAVLDKSNGSVEKNISAGSTLPNGFEELVLGVCDETQIAELKMKIGGFEMHLKRNIKSPESIMPISSRTEPPPIPSKPMTQSAPATSAPPPPPPTSKKTSVFTNSLAEKSKKFAALEASGANGYVFVVCPAVGIFQKSRTVKGKQKILVKEGDLVEEGQTICYLEQLGNLLPVKSDVSGEVIKILFDDGEAVGYKDPIIAVLPSFHDIK